MNKERRRRQFRAEYVSLVRTCVVLSLVMLISACGQTVLRDNEMDVKNWSQEGGFRPQSVATTEKSLPQLQGGSELLNRVDNPASNRKLQQLYPKTLVLHGPMTEKKLALTFDDGPDRRYTPEVLKILDKYQVKATFFLMGARVQALPLITQKIAEQGHAIGNHSFWHPALYKMQLDRVHWEVDQTNESLRQAVGFKSCLFRAPYGGLDEDLLKMLGDMRLSVIGWTIDSEDWKQLTKAEILDNVMCQVHPGGIILMHSGGHWTQNLDGMLEALDALIPMLQDQGYEFVTVPNLLDISQRL